VLIERRAAGQWHVIAQPRVGGGSDYAVVHTFRGHGKIALRAVVQTGTQNLGAESKTVVIRLS
jgi:hypothetical protein